MWDHTRVNPTSISSSVVDNRLRRADATAYSSSRRDGFLLGVSVSSSGDLVRERCSGEPVPLPPPRDLWGEADRRLCEFPGGRRRKSMLFKKDMSERATVSKRVDERSGEGS